MAEQKTELQRTTAPVSAAPASGASSPLQRVISNTSGRWQSLPKAQRTRWAMLAAIALALTAGLSWYGSRTEWKVLFSGLDTKDVQVVSQELTAAGISAKISSDGGAVLVPDDMLDKARMEVASKGMPQSGRMGFEIFDKPNWVGSEFDEKVNYQRALEGELEHTIATLGAVRSARVHLAMAKQSLFASEEHSAKATVVLKLRKGNLGDGQAESIRNLVAGAVENLQPGQVTLVDADGRLNLIAPSQTVQQMDAVRQMEQELIAMLEPVAGRENVRATVHAEYVEATEEKTDEVYDPSLSATVSMERSEQAQGTAPRTAAGVPGAQSNTAAATQGQPANPAQPNTPPLMQNAAANLPVYPQNGSGTSNNVRQENASYAVTRHLTHTAEGPGRVRRLTVAVLVNDRPQSEGTGKTVHTVWKQRSADEMRRLEQLAQAATGFDAKRGDQLVLENVSFQTNNNEVVVAPMQRITEQAQEVIRTPGLLRTVGLVVVGLLLVLMVLRPMVKQTAELMRAPQPLAAAASVPVSLAESSNQPLLAAGDSSLPARNGMHKLEPQGDEQVIFEQVTQQIRQEPKQSTRLLEHWIGLDPEEE